MFARSAASGVAPPPRRPYPDRESQQADGHPQRSASWTIVAMFEHSTADTQAGDNDHGQCPTRCAP